MFKNTDTQNILKLISNGIINKFVIFYIKLTL